MRLTDGEVQLVAALRNGGYRQAHGALRDGNKYCCMGVACDISKMGRWYAISLTEDPVCYLHSKAVLPRAVREWLGWYSSSGYLTFKDRTDAFIELTALNDHGMPFDQIADIIQANLVMKTATEDWEYPRRGVA